LLRERDKAEDEAADCKQACLIQETKVGSGKKGTGEDAINQTQAASAAGNDAGQASSSGTK